MRHHLAYWKPSIADVQRDRLVHAAGAQLARVSKGDVVWIVTIRSGELFLLGRIVVGRVTDQATAQNVLISDDLYEASHHIIAKEGTALPYRSIAITHLAAELEFENSAGRNRLAVIDGRVNAQQLQQMRILTLASSELLDKALFRGDEASGTIGEDVNVDDSRLPEEIDSGQVYREGAAKSILVNAYERSQAARRACIKR